MRDMPLYTRYSTSEVLSPRDTFLEEGTSIPEEKSTSRAEVDLK
jgi:hypothetical protein